MLKFLLAMSKLKTDSFPFHILLAKIGKDDHIVAYYFREEN